MRRNHGAILLALLWAGTAHSWANPGHEVTIAALNEQIAQSPGVPELFFQRAWNYREMGCPKEARADWETTLKLNPGFLPASRELARADASEGRPADGITRLRKAIATAPVEQAFHRAGCFSVLSELLLKLGKNEEALAEAQAGLSASPDLLLDLCLLRSEAQRRLGHHADRVRDLEAAMTKLRSFVLKMKWYDAMIDAGRGIEVLPDVDKEIANTRFQAAWLIRRARIRQLSGQVTGNDQDLSAALQEIGTRLRPENPDLSLVCDRGLIRALQGDLSAAAADLESARQQGADFWMLMPLETLVGSTPVPSAKTAPLSTPVAPPLSPYSTEMTNSLPKPLKSWKIEKS